jgi:hypothetical protein
MIFTKSVAYTIKKRNFKFLKEHYEIQGKESNFNNVHIGSWKINYARGEGG